MGSSIYGSLADLYTKYSRHLCISVFFLTQNIFFRGNSSAQSHSRTIILNTTELVLFANRADRLQALTLAGHIWPGKVNWFMDILEDSTKRDYGYLLICFHARKPLQLMLKINIFIRLGEIPIVYI